MQERRGFTLIELLVVISIVALLSSVVLASLNAAREKGRMAGARQFAAQVEHAAGEQAVAIWEFDECAGTAANDRSGFGNSLSFSGTPTWPTATQSGSGCALGLNSTDQYASVSQGAGTNLNLSSFGSFTVAGWYYLADASAARPFFGVGNPYNANGTGLIVTYGYPSAGQVGYFLDNGSLSGMLGSFGSGSSLTTGRWTFIAVVSTPTLATLYIDGRSVGTVDVSGYGLANLGNSPFRVGAYGASPTSQLWSGSIDAVRVYAKALTASEAGALYAAEAPARGMALE